MKMIKISTVAMLFTSTLAMAGGDIAPVEPVIEAPVAVEAPTKTGFYAGLAYSCMQLATDTPDQEYMGNGISISAGYNFNQFLAVEGRYTASLGDINYQTWNVDQDVSGDLSNIAIYLKPQYSFGTLGIYGLLGYGQTELNEAVTATETSFQYGAGITANMNESVQFFVDYRRLFDDTGFDTLTNNQDVAVNSWSVGVNYNF